MQMADTAGHGWNGWRWTVAKDSCGESTPHTCPSLILIFLLTGFAAFFTIFEISRQLANEARVTIRRLPVDDQDKDDPHPGRIAYATTLVTGGAVAGLCYELVGRPWDNARHLARLSQLAPHDHPTTIPQLLLKKLRDDGALSFFRDPHALPVPTVYENVWKQRFYTASRTLARVGPWGVGFLVWEAYGQ